jgi:hypothetical protein
MNATAKKLLQALDDAITPQRVLERKSPCIQPLYRARLIRPVIMTEFPGVQPGQVMPLTELEALTALRDRNVEMIDELPKRECAPDGSYTWI